MNSSAQGDAHRSERTGVGWFTVLCLVGIVVILAAHAFWPRYELRVIGNAPVTFDRWTGRTYFAGVMIAPGPGDPKPTPARLYRPPPADPIADYHSAWRTDPVAEYLGRYGKGAGWAISLDSLWTEAEVRFPDTNSIIQRFDEWQWQRAEDVARDVCIDSLRRVVSAQGAAAHRASPPPPCPLSFDSIWAEAQEESADRRPTEADVDRWIREARRR